MSEESIALTKKEGVLTVMLNRPKAMNAVDRAMGERLLAVLREAASQADVRVVVLTGAGKAFCAGQDLAELLALEQAGGPPPYGQIVDRFSSIVRTIFGLPKPVIAAVNGAAAGAGANLALACDIVVASAEAYFVQSFVNIGLIPDSGGTFVLPRLVGLARARELMMLGERVPAGDARKMGMITRVTAPETLGAEVETLAAKCAKLPTHALGLIKRALDHSASCSLGEQLAYERELQILAAASADYREGKAAFLEKRPAKFTGN